MKHLNKFLEYSKIPFILAGIIFAASLALLSIFKDAEKQLKELNNAVEISNEMAKSSDDLTNYARYYVTTRDDKWKEKFDHILKVRKGEEPDAQGKKISFKDKVNSVGFNKNELDMILKAETLSNNLAVLEVKAFESIVKGKSEGVWDVQQFHYNNAMMAMFGNDYNKYKNEIMITIEQFDDTVYDRLQNQYSFSMTLAWSIIIVINVSLLLLVLVIQHSKVIVNPVKPTRKPMRQKKPVARKKVES
jgi:hypothetical protein